MDVLLRGLDDTERQRVRALARRRRFRRGEVICHEGDPADTMHLISKGRVAVRATSPLGSVVTLTVIGAGGSFGELALLDDKARRSATVAALEPTETLTLFREEVDGLRRELPVLNDALLRLLREQVVRLSEQLVEALFLPVETRVVRRIRDLAAIYRDATTPDGPVDINLTQEEIASMAGTTRPTANAVLRDLEDQGAIELNRGRLRVLDAEEISRRAR